MQNQYSMRSPAVKRLMKEAQELREPTEQYHVQPLDDNLFEWHFTIRGPADSDFDGGIYHGRIILPPDYPMKPPSIILLTPNGRFEVYKKICLSISGHHPESWQPSWSIRTALLAIIGFMPTHGAGAIGSLDYTPEERKVLAKKSNDWKCENCGCVGHILPPVTKASEKTTQEAKELASQIDFQGEKPKDGTQSSSSQAESISSSTTSSTTSATKSATTSTTESASATTNNGQSPQFPWNPFMANGAQSGMMTPPFGFPYPLPPPAATGNTMAPRFPMPFYAPPMLYPGFPLQNMGAWPQYPMTNLPSSSQSSACSASPGSSSTETSSTPVTSSQTLPSTNSSTHATEPASSSTQITSSASSLTSPISTATTSESLRQRRPAPTQNYRNADLPVHVRSNETFSLFLIIFLVCAIGLLVLRRLYVAFNWGFLNEEL